MKKKLFIEAIAYKKGKAYGYNEFLFNLLDYFYEQRNKIKFEEIIIVINKSQRSSFEVFCDKFNILEYSCDNLFLNAINQAIWNISKDVSNEDVILFTGNYTSIWPKGKKIVVIHDLLYKHPEIISLGLKKYQREIFVPISIKQVEKVICISQFTQHEVLKFYPFAAGKTSVIYNYLNYKKYDSSIGKSRTGFLTVASPSPHKNTVFVLKVFEKYILTGGKQSLSIVGVLNNEMKGLLESMNSDVRNKIKVFSHISNNELGILYASNKTYITASKFEGLGMPIAEAMLFNMHLLLPESPSIYKEISQDKAKYFINQNEDSLLKTMIFMDNVKEGVQYDISLFSVENTSQQYIEIFNSLY